MLVTGGVRMMNLTNQQLQALEAAEAAFRKMAEAFSEEQFEEFSDTLDPNASDSLEQLADAFGSAVKQNGKDICTKSDIL